ncbi:MAG: hypothetical protein U0802_07085 [Candidatus Binatia bacterium]
MARWLILAALVAALPATAQVRTPGSSAVSERSGPIGGDSRPVGDGSRSMRDGARTIGESSSEPSVTERTGGSIRDQATRSMRSGPVSSISSGSMTQPRTLPDGGSMTQHSAGAVKHDIDRPLGSRISEPLRELAPLQAQLRALREHGAAAAVAAAAAPVTADPEPFPDPHGGAEVARPPDAVPAGDPGVADPAAEEPETADPRH